MYNGNFHVTGSNHDGLPSYTLYNYRVRIYGEEKKLTGEEFMPPVEPGKAFNIVFKGIEEPVKVIEFVTGNGILITSKQF
jgi:hypothetical protein